MWYKCKPPAVIYIERIWTYDFNGSQRRRRIYYKRYQVNKSLEQKEHRLDNVQFGKIDFKQVYDEIEKQKGRIEEER